VRTQINVNGLQHFYLNPVTRHPTSIVVDRRLDQINWSQTILYWLVYGVALVVFAWYLFKKAKEKKSQSDAN
jgi:hypothetical protein